MLRHEVEKDKPETRPNQELVTPISTGAISGVLSPGIIGALGALFDPRDLPTEGLEREPKHSRSEMPNP